MLNFVQKGRKNNLDRYIKIPTLGAGIVNANIIYAFIFISRHGEGRPEVSQAATMMDIGTREIFSSEHDMFRQNVRRFFQEEVVPPHSK